MQQAAGLDNVDGKYLGADIEVERAEAAEFEGASVMVSLPLRRGDKESVRSGIVLALGDSMRIFKHLQPCSIAIGQALNYHAHEKHLRLLVAQEQPASFSL